MIRAADTPGGVFVNWLPIGRWAPPAASTSFAQDPDDWRLIENDPDD